MAFIEFKNVVKEYITGEVAYRAVDDVSFSIEEGELVMFVGDSGAGKSTLLNLLGGLDKITYGDIIVNQKSLNGLSEKELTLYRRNSIGFIFQFYNLISALTSKENVEIVKNMGDKVLDIDTLFEYLGIAHRMNHFPSQLSGGEQQRVAIARALYKNPNMLLCDEPTGALDYANSKNILSLIQKVNEEQKKTIIIVTHNSAIECMAHKVVKMKSGKIKEIVINENPTKVENLEW